MGSVTFSIPFDLAAALVDSGRHALAAVTPLPFSLALFQPAATGAQGAPVVVRVAGAVGA